MRNYVSINHGFLFFFHEKDDIAAEKARKIATSPGGAVWRRPFGRRWRDVPQIVGEGLCAVGDLARRERFERGPMMDPCDCSCRRCRGSWLVQ